MGCFVPAPGVKKKLRVVGGEALRVSLLEDDADGRSFAWYLVLGRLLLAQPLQGSMILVEESSQHHPCRWDTLCLRRIRAACSVG